VAAPQRKPGVTIMLEAAGRPERHEVVAALASRATARARELIAVRTLVTHHAAPAGGRKQERRPDPADQGERRLRRAMPELAVTPETRDGAVCALQGEFVGRVRGDVDRGWVKAAQRMTPTAPTRNRLGTTGAEPSLMRVHVAGDAVRSVRMQ
jgi:hypothetical protein